MFPYDAAGAGMLAELHKSLMKKKTKAEAQPTIEPNEAQPSQLFALPRRLIDALTEPSELPAAPALADCETC